MRRAAVHFGQGPQRRVPRRAMWITMLALASLGGGGASVAAQSSASQALITAMQAEMHDMDAPFAGENAAIRQRWQKEIEIARYRSMRADAAKLQKLAADLQAERQQAKGTPLTGEQLRRLAEIEKLARRIRRGMLISSMPGTDMQGPYYVPPSVH